MNAPSAIAEQFAFNDVFRDGGTIKRNERFLCPLALIVDLLGGELFSAATFPCDQHTAVVTAEAEIMRCTLSIARLRPIKA